MLTYRWQAESGEHELGLVRVPGTAGDPFLFGSGANRRPIEIQDFYIGATPVTQALWIHVMGANPSCRPDVRCPVENVSWRHITEPGGFLDRINSGAIRVALDYGRTMAFRLPTEAEWEYAARGGPRWRDDFAFSGSNDPNRVAWYGPRWSKWHQLLANVLSWPVAWRLVGRAPHLPTRTHDVATKMPNQLGIYDMSGNIWEWCEDACVDLDQVPIDGSPAAGSEDAERRLRGGCFNNWDLFCRVWWRYGITPDAHDGCLGFRLILAPER